MTKKTTQDIAYIEKARNTQPTSRTQLNMHILERLRKHDMKMVAVDFLFISFHAKVSIFNEESEGLSDLPSARTGFFFESERVRLDDFVTVFNKMPKLQRAKLIIDSFPDSFNIPASTSGFNFEEVVGDWTARVELRRYVMPDSTTV